MRPQGSAGYWNPSGMELVFYDDQTVVIIKAQGYRTQERNREDALARFQELIDRASTVPRPRKPTRPTKGSQRRRVDNKVKRGQLKAARGRIVE